MRKFKDNLLRGLLWLSAFLTVAVLVMIVGFIFYKGFRLINFEFIGYHVAVVEYRRVLACPAAGWPGTVDDVLAAVAAVRDDADLPEPTVLVGHSAGGHLVALAASRTSAWGLRGAVALAGCVDLRRGVELGMGDGAVRDLLRADPARGPGRPARRRRPRR